MKVREVIAKVYGQHRGLPHRLEEIHGKSAEWYRSWSYPTRKEDEFGNGNKSIGDDYANWICNLLAAANPAAAGEINDGIYQLCRARLADISAPHQTQAEIRRSIIKEFSEALCAFDECDADAASDDDLLRWDDEMRQASEKVDAARAKIRAERIKRTASSKTELRRVK